MKSVTTFCGQNCERLLTYSRGNVTKSPASGAR